MKTVGKLMVLFLWLLSQAVGFAHQVSACSLNWDSTRTLPLTQIQTRACDYDAESWQSHYDLALSASMTGIPANLGEAKLATLYYNAAQDFFFLVSEFPKALPVAKTVFLAAEGGTMATREGLIGISEHLSQLPEGGGLDPGNFAMYNRLTTAFESGQPLSGVDATFYQHELIESSLMDAGMDARAAHLETLSQQGIPYAPGYEAQLYHPTVIQQFPTYFSPAARAAAGVH